MFLPQIPVYYNNYSSNYSSKRSFQSTISFKSLKYTDIEKIFNKTPTFDAVNNYIKKNTPNLTETDIIKLKWFDDFRFNRLKYLLNDEEEEFTKALKLLSIDDVKNVFEFYSSSGVSWFKRHDFSASKFCTIYSKNASGVNYLTPDEKKNLIFELSQELRHSKTVDNFLEFGFDLNKTMAKLRNEEAPIIKVDNKKQIVFMKNFMTNNNAKVENLLKTFDFSKFSQSGLPLKYPRNEFVQNVDNILKDLNKNDKEILLNHFGLNKGEQDFDGIPNIEPFEGNPYLRNYANKIEQELKKFLLENRIETEDAEFNKVINSLINGLPEFTSIIGKIQSSEHKHTIDIHTLKVLQTAMNNPDYEKLSDQGKTVLKFSILMHDLAKTSSNQDFIHPESSAQQAQSILKRFNIPQKTIKNQIIDIIQNHHWFEKYNKNSISEKDVAIRIRTPENLTIYSIFAKADLQNVNDKFHFRKTKTHSLTEYNDYMDRKIDNIRTMLSEKWKNSNIFYDTKFIKNGLLFPKKIIKLGDEEIEARILDLNELDENTDLSIYGFSKGVKKKDLRFEVHMTKDLQTLQTAKELLDSPLNQTILSTSLINPLDNNNTFRDYPFGWILETSFANILKFVPYNIGSGTHKNFSEYIDTYFEKNTILKNLQIKYLKKHNIDLSDDEYEIIFKNKGHKKFLTNNCSDLCINNKIIPAQLLKNCIKDSTDEFLKMRSMLNRINELVSINSTTSGLYLKKDYFHIQQKYSYDNDSSELKEFFKFANANKRGIIMK